MNQPSFPKLLMYVAIVVIGGVSLNMYFNDKSKTQRVLQKESDGTLFSRADYGVLEYSREEKRNPKRVKVKLSNGGFKLIMVTDILYCISKNDNTLITTNVDSKAIKTSSTLKKLKEDFGDLEFIYNDLKSYCVNMRYIDKVVPCKAGEDCRQYDYFIEMTDGEKIKLPKDKKKAFEEELDDFIKYAQE